MNSGCANALASYKSNLAAFNLTNENVDISRDVYNTVVSQYNEGIKTYLEVIVSETDLRTAQLNNLSSLIQLMFSKIDVEKALATFLLIINISFRINNSKKLINAYLITILISSVSSCKNQDNTGKVVPVWECR